MNIALFDFDGTVTFKDTFTPFIYFATSRTRIALGTVLLGPMILGYKLGLIAAPRMRAAIARVAFQGRRESEVKELGARYSGDAVCAGAPRGARADSLAPGERRRRRGGVGVARSLSERLVRGARRRAVAARSSRARTESSLAGTRGVTAREREGAQGAGASRSEAVPDHLRLRRHEGRPRAAEPRDQAILSLAGNPAKSERARASRDPHLQSPLERAKGRPASCVADTRPWTGGREGSRDGDDNIRARSGARLRRGIEQRRDRQRVARA